MNSAPLAAPLARKSGGRLYYVSSFKRSPMSEKIIKILLQNHSKIAIVIPYYGSQLMVNGHGLYLPFTLPLACLLPYSSHTREYA